MTGCWRHASLVGERREIMERKYMHLKSVSKANARIITKINLYSIILLSSIKSSKYFPQIGRHWISSHLEFDVSEATISYNYTCSQNLKFLLHKAIRSRFKNISSRTKRVPLRVLKYYRFVRWQLLENRYINLEFC